MTCPFEPCACVFPELTPESFNEAREKLNRFRFTPETFLLTEEQVADTIWLHDVIEQLWRAEYAGYDNVTLRVEGDEYAIKLGKEPQK